MKRCIYISILTFLVLQSCVDHKSHEYSLADVSILIDLDSVKKAPLKLGDIRYIPLETSENFLIGHADKVLIKNGRIYVADFNQTKSLFIFNLDGKFLFKINRKGQGPEEYISFYDFDITDNGDIYLFDQNAKKFLVLDSEGKYQRVIKSDFYFFNFCVFNEKMYWSKLYDGKMFSNLAVYDMKNERTTFLFDDKNFLHDIHFNFSPYNFYYSPNHTYYSPKFSEIIYSIDKDGIIPAIGIKNLPKPPIETIEKWEQNIEEPIEPIESIYKSRYFIENVYIYETDDYISIECKIGGFSPTLLYNKQLKLTYSIQGGDYFENIGNMDIHGSTGKDFFSVISFNPDNEYHKKILESRKELKNWKEDDNPVIAIFNLDM